MKKSNFLPTIVLGCICLVVALLLSLVNSITGPIIEAAQNAAANEALLEVLPEGKNFEELTLDDKYPSSITKGYRADGGYVFQATVTGKSSGLIIMFGIDAEGKIVGTKVIAEQETDSYDKNVFPLVEGLDGKYTGMGLDSFEPFLVSGATLTSRAYGEAAKAALQAVAIAGGADVDIRTPEQILQDNCNEALGTEGVSFTRWFATEVLTDIKAVYQAADKSGMVFAIGEDFVGVKNDGSIVTAGDVDPAVITAAYEVISSAAITEVAELPEGVHKNVQKIYKTESGNYVFEVKADGFSVHQYEEYSSGSNTPILIKVAISADGKIIDCLTLESAESKGYGDRCETQEYLDTWAGITADRVVISSSPITGDCTDPGAISGATYTTEAYQKAIQRAFAAFELLTAQGGE